LWKSSNENVAKVDNGKVEALEKGTAKITVIAKKGDISSEAQCDVTVEVNPLYESINFIDAYLKQRLLDIPGLDANKDGNISVKEAQTIHKLNFSYAVGETTTDENTIKSLEGLQYFVNLDTLTLNYHKVSDATPISKLDKLSQLHIGGNFIKSLDVSSLKELRDLRVFKCEIEELNLAKNSKLQILDIHNTNIKKLDFTPLKELVTVVARATKLTSVNLTDMPKLTGIALRQGVLEEFTANNLPQPSKTLVGSMSLGISIRKNAFQNISNYTPNFSRKTNKKVHSIRPSRQIHALKPKFQYLIKILQADQQRVSVETILSACTRVLAQ